MGDVALITCKKGVGKSGMPSKTWSIMACNTPIIASFDLDSDFANTINESSVGWVVSPEDADLLYKSIYDAFADGIKCTNGRRFAFAHASKKQCVKKYVDEMTNSRSRYESADN